MSKRTSRICRKQQRIFLDKRVAENKEQQKQATAQKRKDFWDKLLRRNPAPMQSSIQEEIAVADTESIEE